MNTEHDKRIENLCVDMFEIFSSSHKKDRQQIIGKLSEITRHFFSHPITLDSMETLLELERKLLTAKGQNKQYIEQRVFEILGRITLVCEQKKGGKQRLSLTQDLVEHEKDSNEKQKHRAGLKLVNFAHEIFQFKKARDNFSSKRKALALDILTRLSMYYEIPDAHDLCLISLKSNRKDLILAAIEFLDIQDKSTEEGLDPEVIDLLNAIIQKTKDRSVAVSAMDLQVKTGHITEFGALSKIDDWKEKHLYS